MEEKWTGWLSTHILKTDFRYGLCLVYVTVFILEFNTCRFLPSLFLLDFLFSFLPFCISFPTIPSFVFFFAPLLPIPSVSFIHSFPFLSPFFLIPSFFLFKIPNHWIYSWAKLNKMETMISLLPFQIPDSPAWNGHWPGLYCMAINKLA